MDSGDIRGTRNGRGSPSILCSDQTLECVPLRRVRNVVELEARAPDEFRAFVDGDAVPATHVGVGLQVVVTCTLSGVDKGCSCLRSGSAHSFVAVPLWRRPHRR